MLLYEAESLLDCEQVPCFSSRKDKKLEEFKPRDARGAGTLRSHLVVLSSFVFLLARWSLGA